MRPLIAIALLGTVSLVAADGTPSAERAAPAKGFAVVELFTSQGCSSCPAADRRLTEIGDIARSGGEPVYCLSFHVDYWNQLGWKDPFSSPEASARQRAYDAALGSHTYTPQMIVNGSTEFVGSDGGKARSAIAQALAQPAAVQVMATRSAAGFEVTVTPSLSKPAEVNLALVEAGLVTQVPAGENSGRRLENNHVVRSFSTMPLKDSKASFAQPASEFTKLEAVVFVSDAETHRILGATRVPGE